MKPERIATWAAVLAGLLGACDPLIAVHATPLVLAFASGSGILIAAAPWLARARRAYGYVALMRGALPFAVATWTTAITPLVALLAVAAGLTAIHAGQSAPAVPRARSF
jgi:hypothetical protein